jgi:hypothetical protein
MLYDLESIISSAKRVQAKLDEQQAEIAKLSTPLGKLSGYLASERPEWHGFGTRKYGDWADPSQSAEQKRYEDLLAKMQAQLEIAKQNAEIRRANSELIDKVIVLVHAVGLHKTVSETTWKRNTPKTTTRDAEWVTKINDAWLRPRYSEKDVQEWIQQLNNHYKAYTDKIKADQIAIEKKARDEESAKKKMQIVIKVAMELHPETDPLTFDANSLLDDLRAKDKYLDLAIAMQDTRGDWSDGFYRVKNALNLFKVETPEDEAIAENVSACAYGEESDGRIFRDCEWNYGRIFGLVNPTIYKMYESLSQILE